MSRNAVDHPKTFISYSWSSPEHEEWVINLATELEESGVHVILDKWDLGEGADKFAFMEQMVTEPGVRRVIAVCDRLFAEKADGREGGVGTETQIMSREVYEQVDPADREQKFLALVTEKDKNGDAYVPTFLKSRIYIDMSDETLHAEGFEQLLRWIYGKPLYKRPKRGKPPAYLFAEDELNLGTGARFRRAVEAVRQNKNVALGAIQEYFDTFADNLEAFRIESTGKEAFYAQVIASIESFRPYRDELVDLFLAIARYRTDSEAYEAVQTFFERILPYGFWPAGQSTWSEVNADNFRFILHELFLYATASLLRHGRFERVKELVEPGFYFAAGSPDVRDGGLVPFTFFNNYVVSLEHWNQQLNPGWLSPEGQLLKERATRTDLPFDDIMQAELILFIRGELLPEDKEYVSQQWYPDTLVYASHRDKPFEVFARAQSTAYFDRMKVALGIENQKELLQLMVDYQSKKRRVPKWNFRSLSNFPKLINLEKIATRP